MIRAYEVNAEIEALLTVIEAMEDENSILLPDEELFVKLHALKMERAFAIAQMGRVYKNYRAEEDAVAAEKRFLSKRLEIASGRVERAKSFLREIMRKDEKYKDAGLSIYWQKKPDELILSSDIPDQYLRKEPKLKDIRDLLKTEKVPWASLKPVEEKALVVK